MQAMPSPWIGRGWTQEAMIGGTLRDAVPSETRETSERGLGIRRRRWNAPGNRHKRSLRVLKFMLHLHRPYAKCPYPLGCARGWRAGLAMDASGPGRPPGPLSRTLTSWYPAPIPVGTAEQETEVSLGPERSGAQAPRPRSIELNPQPSGAAWDATSSKRNW